MYVKRSVNVNGNNNKTTVVAKWMQAHEVQIGDMLEVYKSNPNSNEREMHYVKVNDIQFSFDNVRSIVTENGELIVNDVRVSSYSHTTKFHYLTYLLSASQYLFPTLPQKIDKMVKYIENKIAKQ